MEGPLTTPDGNRGAMAKAKAKTTAKQSIVDALRAEVEDRSLRGVQVAKLIEKLGMNRNTFYYHFPSKYDVALYAFRTDLAAALRQSFPEHELVYAPLDAGRDAEALPCYVHREIGARTLDLGDFFKELVRCVLASPAFYSKLFDYKEPEFHTLITELYRPIVRKDLEFVLGGRYLPQSTIELFQHRYTELIYETAEYYLRHSRDAEAMLDNAVNPFWNMPYDALVYELQMHPIKRPRRL